MHTRIIFGKLKPGTWNAYEEAYKDVMKKAGRIPGLRGRWLTRDVNDPDAGYSISLWQDQASMTAYERSAVFEKDIRPRLSPFFSGEYTTTHCEMRSHESFD